MKVWKGKKIDLTYTQIIALFFITVVVLGTFLLCLPISSKSREWTPVLDSAFTATSATCVTGLIVYDTFLHWSRFGQIVILGMIQTGGLGVMTIITMFSIFLKRKISLYERKLLMQSAGTMRTSGVVRLLKQIIKGTFIFETAGAALLATRFCGEFGIGEGIYCAIFHSVSAFCNAGFDLMGRFGAFSSLTPFVGDVVVNITICALIIVGGIGFLVWSDVVRFKFNIKKYSLHSKIVLVTTAALLLIGWVLIFVFERDASMAGMPLGKQIMAAFFQSVTVRTAGFNTIATDKLSESGNIIMTLMMFIGGSPGSTAGGIKTTTFAVLVLEVFAASHGRKETNVFKKNIDDDTVKRASAIASIYLLADLAAAMVICAIEKYNLSRVLFEVVSAAGTVGITTGITPSLGVVSHIILMFLMFAGRVGGLTLMLVLAEQKKVIPLKRPGEKILIG